MSFIDTNVLAHSTAVASPFRNQARSALVKFAKYEPLFISHQILREYLAVMTRPQPWGKPLGIGEALSDVEDFSRRFTVLGDSSLVWGNLLSLCRNFQFGGRQVHDGNIVATMLAHGQRRLLTFNAADFRRFASVIDIEDLVNS